MFSPKLNVSRQMMPASATRTSLKSKTGRRLNSVPTGQRKQNKSLNVSELPSGLAELGPEHVLSEYGTPVPVAVTEALALLPRGIRPSSKLDQNGWVWLVCGSKLIVWNFKNVPQNKIGCCYELLLPTCDLQHHADLVTVFESADRKSTTSCLAVSPEGAVRYWYNIGFENSYTMLDLGLRGESCSLLTTLQLPDMSFVVGTSFSTFIHIALIQGQLGSRIMKPLQGMLSGIGRRVTSLFFRGSQSPQTASGGSPLYQLLAGEMLGPEGQALYALSGGSLQKWIIVNDQERMLYEFSLEGPFREHLARSVWKKDPTALPRFNCWLMDLQLVRDGVRVLGAGVNLEASAEVFYAIGILHTEGEDMPQSFLSFSVTGHHAVYSSDDESQISLRLLVPNLASAAVFLYNRETIACVADGKPEESPDVVDFQNIGAGCCDGLPLFVSSQGCLVKIQQTMTDFMTSAVDVLSKTMSFSKLDTSIAATANMETISKMSTSSDRSARLKAAFLASLRDSMHQPDAQSIVDDLFPMVATPSIEPGSLLDTLVIGMSQEIVDDYPASDPRWVESLPSGLASTSASLILLYQLDDKQKAHEFFLCFLKNYNLWDRLSLATVRDGEMKTQMFLCENAEKIEATKALRNLHSEYNELVDQAIDRVLSRRQLVPFNNLTPQDLFYREVSQIHEILPSLVECEEERLRCKTSAQEIISLISAVNTIIKDVILAANRYRQMRAAMYRSNAAVAKEPEFIPWTSSTGPRGLRHVLRRQYDVTVEYLPEARNNLEKGALFQQLVDLADMFLDGYCIQLDSLKARFLTTKQPDAHYLEVLRIYELERAAVIKPFTDQRQYERAISLAEKYCDFATLVELCDELNNPDRLQMYMEKFKDQGFSDFVFQWHMNAGKRGKLMKSSYLSNPSLGKFLHTKENKFMSWMHDVAANNYDKAHLTLLELGQEETQHLAKKKTLLSLSKLAAFANVEKTETIISNIDIINSEQDLILHQEQLLFACPEVRESLAVDDVDNMKVLTVTELIDLYIGEYNVNANEFDFKKALDLVDYTDQANPDVNWHDTLLQIWSKAILRDRWSQPPLATDPIETCCETIFYKTLDLVISEDGNLEELLPSADELLSSEYLGELRNRSDFQCMLRATYEHINRMAVDA